MSVMLAVMSFQGIFPYLIITHTQFHVSVIHSLNVRSKEHVAICPSVGDIAPHITLPSWPANIFTGDQRG